MKKQVLNPYLPLYEYIPDGEPRIFNNRLYVYGSHDYSLGEKGFCPGDYMGYSAPLNDLRDWTSHGVIYAKAWDPNLNEEDSMAAPDVVEGLDGRYYLYFNSNAKLACHVAVSDSPEGPFSFYGFVQNPDGTPYEEYKCFDPGVLVDNGHVYIYFGFCMPGPVPERFKGMKSPFPKWSFGFELEADMKTIKKGPFNIIPGGNVTAGTGFEGHGFYEASSPRKIKDTYVMVFSSEKSHDLAYALSKEPFGPYTYKGVLVSNCNIGYQGNEKPEMPFGNTHGGIVQTGEDWYVFYHRQTDGQEASRQACAEKLELDQDGWFLQAQTTSCGLNGGPLLAEGSYNATYCCYMVAPEIKQERYTVRDCRRDSEPHIHQEDIDGEETHALHYIANIQSEITLGYRYFQFDKPTSLVLRLKGDGPIQVQIFLDKELKKKIGEVSAVLEKEWENIEVPLLKTSETHELYINIVVDNQTCFESFTFKKERNKG
ncbi:MAG: family 43 glycosylhydrolase [Solobacterium sp.]|nr:family 43 glycosylhydrolase [Solobacterium sp.]